jgi:hypothetical protein
VGEFHYFHHGAEYRSDPSARFKYDTLVLEAAQEVGIRIVLLQAMYCFAGITDTGKGDTGLNAAQERFKAQSFAEFDVSILILAPVTLITLVILITSSTPSFLHGLEP